MQHRNVAEIRHLVRENLRLNSEVLQVSRKALQVSNQLLQVSYKISERLDRVETELRAQTHAMDTTNRVLSEIAQTLQNPRAVEAAERARIAANNIAEAQSMSESRAKRLLDEAFDLLTESLEIHPFDHKANFDLAWLYQFYKHDLAQAEAFYDTAVLRALKKDAPFAVFALRHLAEVRSQRGDVKGALEALQEAREVKNTEQVSIELGRCLVRDGQDEHALGLLSGVLGRSTDYFEVLLLDPIIGQSPTVLRMLEDRLQDVKDRLLQDMLRYFEPDYTQPVYTWYRHKLFGGEADSKVHGSELDRTDLDDLKETLWANADRALAGITYKDLVENRGTHFDELKRINRDARLDVIEHACEDGRVHTFYSHGVGRKELLRVQYAVENPFSDIERVPSRQVTA